MALDFVESALRGDLLRCIPSASSVAEPDRLERPASVNLYSGHVHIGSLLCCRLASLRAIRDRSNPFTHLASWLSACRAGGKDYAVHFDIPHLEVEIFVLGRKLDLRNAQFQVEDLLHL